MSEQCMCGHDADDHRLVSSQFGTLVEFCDSVEPCDCDTFTSREAP